MEKELVELLPLIKDEIYKNFTSNTSEATPTHETKVSYKKI